jgi:asparagine synthase (glutamine-hydrolysing)
MCGIAGYISFKHRDFSLSSLIPHRGPDDNGSYEDGPVHLEHRRLSIIDLSSSAHQPMATSDGNFVVVFNGEIYNHLEIREELSKRGHTFKSHSDTETLLLGYVEFGQNIINKLNGIFAFAIYDKRTREVLLVRDHYGVKPLYYYHKEDIFLFSSEIKSFLAFPEFDRALNYAGMFDYLQFLYSPTTATPFRHVSRLDSGNWMKIKINTNASTFAVCDPVQYYDIPFNGQYSLTEETETIIKLDQSLQNAVSRQLLSDVPVGFFLSGGLDSSLVVALAANQLERSRMECFTIATGDDMVKEGVADDLPYAKQVAKYLGVKLNIIEAVPQILQDFDRMIWHLDEPQADASALHVYNISNQARQSGIKVLLGGVAGDDLFTGYRRHMALRLEGFFHLMPQLIRSGFGNATRLLPSNKPVFRRLKRVGAFVEMEKYLRMAGYFAWYPSETIQQLFNKDLAIADNSTFSINTYMKLLKNIPEEHSDINRMLYWELKTFLVNHNLNYSDKMSMAAGVEARVPFLDRDLVDVSTRIHPDLKMRGNVTKYILKRVAEKYLPSNIIYRSKSGFGAPVRKWIKTDLREMVHDRLSDSAINRRGLFSSKAIAKVLSDNDSGKEDNTYLIFSLLAMESWLSQFTDR